MNFTLFQPKILIHNHEKRQNQTQMQLNNLVIWIFSRSVSKAG